MGEAGQAQQNIRFGVFEVDLRSGELRKAGVRVRLQEQPFKVLTALLEHPGEVVTRDELRSRIWPHESSGDFDHAVNIAIAKLRTALGDSAEAPHLIETLHRRGYRFILPVRTSLRETLRDSAEHPRVKETFPKRGYRFVASQISSANQPIAVIQGHSSSLKAAILVAVIGLMAAAIIGLWYLGSHRWKALESLAVVPFVDDSANPKLDYLCEGISEGLIDSLSRIPELTVRPRSSVRRYKGKDVDPQVVAKDLKVQAVVLGHIRQLGDSIVVTTELVDADSNRTLWGDTYDRKLSDLLQVQRDIALEISAHLRQKLTPEQKAQVSKTASADPEAYQSYLKGRYYWEKRTPDGLQQARDYFNQAIARDPNLAQAYVGLADYWTVAPDFLSVSLSKARPNEKEAALKALAIDSNYAPAHLALANALFDNWEWVSADREYQRALELDPKFANAHHWYGLGLSFIGRHEEALGHLQRAVELDPLNPKYNANLGLGYVNARQYDRALEQLNKTLQIDPTFFMTYEYLALLYRATGRYELWLQTLRKKAALNENSNRVRLVDDLAAAYAAGGYHAAVRRIIEVKMEELPWSYIDPAELAYEYAALGNKKEAFRWLEKAYNERSRSLQTIAIEPSMNAFRSDPRYIDLLHRMRLGS